MNMHAGDAVGHIEIEELEDPRGTEADEDERDDGPLMYVPRAMRIENGAVNKYGYTAELPMYRLCRCGKDPRGAAHTQTCNQRVCEQIVKGDAPKTSSKPTPKRSTTVTEGNTPARAADDYAADANEADYDMRSGRKMQTSKPSIVKTE